MSLHSYWVEKFHKSNNPNHRTISPTQIVRISNPLFLCNAKQSWETHPSEPHPNTTIKPKTSIGQKRHKPSKIIPTRTNINRLHIILRPPLNTHPLQSIPYLHATTFLQKASINVTNHHNDLPHKA